MSFLTCFWLLPQNEHRRYRSRWCCRVRRDPRWHRSNARSRGRYARHSLHRLPFVAKAPSSRRPKGRPILEFQEGFQQSWCPEASGPSLSDAQEFPRVACPTPIKFPLVDIEPFFRRRVRRMRAARGVIHKERTIRGQRARTTYPAYRLVRDIDVEMIVWVARHAEFGSAIHEVGPEQVFSPPMKP